MTAKWSADRRVQVALFIGGNLATNAGGTQALSYGVARDLVIMGRHV